MLDLRKALCWQPLFGGGLRMGWGETLGLTFDEARDLAEWASEQRGREIRAAFPPVKKR